jgi:hypothetical protein
MDLVAVDPTKYDAQDRSVAAPCELPPGDFVSHQLQSDTLRFLQEVKAIVRRRAEPRPDPDR